MTSRALALSRLPVGSSASRTRGRLISARAIATRCCWPPESFVGELSATRRRRARQQVGPARAGLLRRQAGEQPGSSTLSAALRFPIRLKNWKTKPISRRRTSAHSASL